MPANAGAAAQPASRTRCVTPLAKVRSYLVDRLAYALSGVDDDRKQQIVDVVDELVTRFTDTAAGPTRRTA